MGGLEPYYEEMLRCTRCGYCQAACPTFEALHEEGATARGRVQLLRAVGEGLLPLTAAVGERLWRCLDCRSCTLHCPGGVRLDQIFARARQHLAGTAAFPQSLWELNDRVCQRHNISGEDNAARLLWLQNMMGETVAAQQAETAFWVGCVAGLYPMVYDIPQSFSRMLHSLGEPFVILGGEEWCCGYPLLSAGLPADGLVAHNMEALRARGVRRLLTTCPSCLHAWRSAYPQGEFQVLHAVEYLAQLAGAGRIPWAEADPLTVTFHDPCDLGRKEGVYDAPRQVLAAMPGVELREMSDHGPAAMCCGGGGNLESVDVELSRAIADMRLAQAQATGTQAIVTACQQCQRTLAMAARRGRVRLRVWDLSQLVWQRMARPGGGER
ncbi:MAG: (Fe-S)-binding protein [Chloroflexi bacterium]|nr:(Fe-S)-binding protein [Chloroflexota bacterium]